MSGTSLSLNCLIVALLVVALSRVAKRVLTWARVTYYMTALPGPRTPGFSGDGKPERRDKMHRWVKRWADKFGPVFVFRLAHKSIVFVTEPMPELFKLPRSAMYSWFNWITCNKPMIISRQSTDPLWKAVRKAVTKVFSQSNLQRLFPTFVDHTNALLDGALAGAARTGQPIEIIQHMKTLLVHMLGHIAFEMDLADPKRQQEMATLLTAMHEAMEAQQRAMFMPPRSLFVWDPLVRRDARAVRAWNALIERFASETLRERAASGNASSIVAALRGARTEDGRPIPARQLFAEIAIFFIAGVDTTGHTLAWTLLLLSQHPRAVSQIVQELEAAGLKATKGQPAREIAYSDLSKLPFINACIREAMRLEPVTPSGSWRDADRDLRIGEHFIPAGTTIALHFLGTFTSERNFPDAEKFVPERWLGDSDGGGMTQAHAPVTVSHAQQLTNASLGGVNDGRGLGSAVGESESGLSSEKGGAMGGGLGRDEDAVARLGCPIASLGSGSCPVGGAWATHSARMHHVDPQAVRLSAAGVGDSNGKAQSGMNAPTDAANGSTTGARCGESGAGVARDTTSFFAADAKAADKENVMNGVQPTGVKVGTDVSSAAADAAGEAEHRSGGGACPRPQQMYPFSMGERNCVGRALAQMEMTVFIAKLFSRFRVELAEDQNTVASLYADEVLALTSGPRSLHMRLFPWDT